MSHSLAAVKRLSSKDRSIVVVVEAKGCQLTSKFSSFKMQTKPVDAEETVLAAILLPESEFSRGGKRSSSFYCRLGTNANMA